MCLTSKVYVGVKKYINIKKNFLTHRQVDLLCEMKAKLHEPSGLKVFRVGSNIFKIRTIYMHFLGICCIISADLKKNSGEEGFCS